MNYSRDFTHDLEWGQVGENTVAEIVAGDNDGDSIVKLETFADKVLVFKKRKLFVVSYSNTVGDYLDNTFDFMGIVQPGHSFPTARGIVFMNNLGVHLYDGETVRTLTGKMEDVALDAGFGPANYGSFVLPSIITGGD